MFAAIYDSPWHNPLLFYLCGGVFLISLCRRLPFLTSFALLFTLVILADALLNGALPPYSPAIAAGPWPQRVAILFVLLGDWRFFLLAERALQGAARATSRGAYLRSVLWTLLPSVLGLPLAELLQRLLPGQPASRLTFLAYEAAFAVVLLPLWWFVMLRPRAARLPLDLRRYLRALLGFEALQYALWALADVLIIAGSDGGFLLRLVPNVMYYAAFVPFAFWLAPPSLRPERA